MSNGLTFELNENCTVFDFHLSGRPIMLPVHGYANGVHLREVC